MSRRGSSRDGSGARRRDAGVGTGRKASAPGRAGGEGLGGSGVAYWQTRWWVAGTQSFRYVTNPPASNIGTCRQYPSV